MHESSEINLEKNGYMLISNILSDDELNYGLSSIKDSNKVDYLIMKKFIDNIFLEKIKLNCKTIKEPHYLKFRFSNNNNSNDASTFMEIFIIIVILNYYRYIHVYVILMKRN